jgi:hypothetical protein
MEVIIILSVVFVAGYAFGRARSARKRRVAQVTTAQQHGGVSQRRGATSHYRGSSRRYPSREREYGGFGALGAQHDAGDSGF